MLAHKLKTILQRAQGKDYQDISALLAAGIDLADGLAAAQTLFGATFAPGEALRGLCYVDDLVERYRLTDAALARIRQAVAGVDPALPVLRLSHKTIRAHPNADR